MTSVAGIEAPGERGREKMVWERYRGAFETTPPVRRSLGPAVVIS